MNINIKEEKAKKRSIEIANVLIKRYEELTGKSLKKDELKLQKLMYFLQRNSYALTGKFILTEDFEGWIYGPVLKSLRKTNFEYNPEIANNSKLTPTEIYIIDNVIYEFKDYTANQLKDLSHQEISWKNSRKGLTESEAGNVKISKKDIKEDAKKVRIYDYIYDMYLDEFEDLDDL